MKSTTLASEQEDHGRSNYTGHMPWDDAIDLSAYPRTTMKLKIRTYKICPFPYQECPLKI